MRCQTCGASNSDDARFCVNCGQKLEAEESLPGGSPPYQRFGGSTYEPFGDSDSHPQHIPNYLIPSILVTIFCCLPLGIAAIIFAAQVNGKVAAGDIAGAQSSSRTARTLVIVPVVVGAVVIGIALLAGLLGDPPPELINE